jgi:hypothetical protein
MGEDTDGHGGPPAPPAEVMQAAISRLEEALVALDKARVPLASAYVDLALSLCFSEWERRMIEK